MTSERVLYTMYTLYTDITIIFHPASEYLTWLFTFNLLHCCGVSRRRSRRAGHAARPARQALDGQTAARPFRARVDLCAAPRAGARRRSASARAMPCHSHAPTEMNCFVLLDGEGGKVIRKKATKKKKNTHEEVEKAG